MRHFHCCYPLKGCTSSHGTWAQLSRQMTSLLCSDQMLQMGRLTCLSSGKQVFPPGSAVDRETAVSAHSVICVQFDPSPPVTHHCPFLLQFPFRLLMTILYFLQIPGSQLHDKQTAEGCSFLRPVERTLHGHTQSLWICFGQ